VYFCGAIGTGVWPHGSGYGTSVNEYDVCAHTGHSCLDSASRSLCASVTSCTSHPTGNETAEVVRPPEVVHPLDCIDQQVPQRQVKPSLRGLANETIRPSLACGTKLAATNQTTPLGVWDPECQQASVSPKVAMYLTAAEQYFGTITMTAAKQSTATLQPVRNLRKDRPRKAKSMPKSSK
jgi:hypothetical protein